jgi:hypothetical protein
MNQVKQKLIRHTCLLDTTMNEVHIQWLKGCFGTPREEASASFQIRIKLTPKEAERRLTKIRERFLVLKNVITQRCRMIEQDRRLEKALLEADNELWYSVVALRSYRVGEQHFIGDAVLCIEELMDEAVDLLVKARPHERKHQDTWSLLNTEAKSLAERINDWGFSVLSDMRELLYEKAYSSDPPETTRSTWRAWLRSWVCGSDQRRKTAGGGNNKAKAEEHREREHLFSPNRQLGQDCGCFNYR